VKARSIPAAWLGAAVLLACTTGSQVLHHHCHPAGDVHLCCSGRLYSYPKLRPLHHDWRYIANVTSSAIINAPPPDNLAKALQLFGHAGFTNKHTKNKMVKVFRDHWGRKKVSREGGG
jgi:hypothetical protein